MKTRNLWPLACLWLGLATASAQTNLALLVSSLGDYIGAGRTYVTTNQADIGIAGTATTPTFSAFGFSIYFSGPGGAPLTVGTYTNASRSPLNDAQPGLNVFGNGRACNTVCGEFQIFELHTNADGYVDRFWVTFTQVCECSFPPLLGEIRYNSQLAPPAPPPRILRVPSQFATIQSALDAANVVTSDTILVDPGVYRENLWFNGRNAQVISTGGPDVTFIAPTANTMGVQFSSGETRQAFKQTFYPSVTDPDKAEVLEVSEGGELRNVDIEVEPPLATFKVTGRIIDSETGKPIPNVPIGLERTDGDSSMSTTGAAGSNENGEIKLENVMPGHYKVFAAGFNKADLRADPVAFDVVDSDVTGLEIKARRAATLSGVVVLQNVDEKTVAPRPAQIQIFAMVESPGKPDRSGNGTQVAADGSFKIGGLVGGNVQLMLSLMQSQASPTDIEIVSVDQDGVPQPKGIDLKNGEQLSGIRVLARYKNLTGSIHGQVNFENGEPPPGTQSHVSVKPVDEKPSTSPINRSGGSSQLDSRGRFLISQLEAGIYEVTLTVFTEGQARYYKQQVTVTNNSVSEVTIPVKLKP